MFQHVIIGQYLPGQSLLHKMDARSKLICMIVFVMIVFSANNWLTYTILSGVSFGLFAISSVPFSYMRKGLYPIFLLIIFTFLLHAFFTKEGNPLIQVGAFTIYEGGIEQGIFIAFRLFLLVFTTSLLTLTTSPIDLSDAFEQFLTPAKRIGVPAHEIAMMMSIAIRFIPTLLQETDKIVKAQTARGADFSKGSIKERMQAIISLLIPLFVRAFKRAEDLAYAMEARGYDGGEGRTKLRKLSWSFLDTVGVIAMGIFAVLMWMIRG